MTLHEVRGHDEARRALARARFADRLPDSLLIHGPPGVGKQRLALWLAQLLLCEAPGERGPCSECRACRLSVRLEHPDLHWHFPLPRPRGAGTPEKLADALEEARATELAARREQPLHTSHGEAVEAHYLAAARTLRRRAHSRPSVADVQVFIIGDAETLVPQESSPEAANALLKLLEEPPHGTRMVLTSSEPGRLLPTIRSRCLPLHLSPLTEEQVRDFLVEVAGASPQDAEKAGALSQGSIGRALGFLPGDEGAPLDDLRTQAFELVRAATDQGGAIRASLAYGPTGARGLLDLFAFVEEWLRDIAAVAAGASGSVLNRDRGDDLARIARGVDAPSVALALSTVSEAREQARGNVNPQLIVHGLVTRLGRSLAGRRDVGP